jgi:hypothetical protein
MYHPDSLLFAPTINDHVDYIDPNYPYTTADCSWMDPVSWGLESGECLEQHPVEVVYDAVMMSEENGNLSPLLAGRGDEWSRLGVGHVTEQWLGSEVHGFEQHQQWQQPSMSSPPPVIQFEQQHPTFVNPIHPTHNPPIESFRGGYEPYDYRHCHSFDQPNIPGAQQ